MAVVSPKRSSRGVRGLPYKRAWDVCQKFWKEPLTGTKILLCGRSLNLFLPIKSLEDTVSKTCAGYYMLVVICRSRGGLSANGKEENNASNDKRAYWSCGSCDEDVEGRGEDGAPVKTRDYAFMHW